MGDAASRPRRNVAPPWHHRDGGFLAEPRSRLPCRHGADGVLGNDICRAYGFATKEQYLKFSPGAEGSQGRFRRAGVGPGAEKDLAWFSTPPGEKDFFKTDFGVVQHEVVHQLLDAYTDNCRLPFWFSEGCATFFESWDLGRPLRENMLSGIGGRYSATVCASFPEQKGEVPLARYWFEGDRLLNLDPRPTRGPVIRDPRARNPLAALKDMLPLQQQYSESWCAMTFLVHDNNAGGLFLSTLIKAFREGKDLASIRNEHYTPRFVDDFQQAWYRFIKEKVLKKSKLRTVGGREIVPGIAEQVPKSVTGHALTEDRLCDVFLVESESRELDGESGKFLMLKAWGIPTAFYETAWKEAPFAVSGKRIPLVEGLYFLLYFAEPTRKTDTVLLLWPAWREWKSDPALLQQRLEDAVKGLSSKAKTESPESPKKSGSRPSGSPPVHAESRACSVF